MHSLGLGDWDAEGSEVCLYLTLVLRLCLAPADTQLKS
jgi:hypothetical protein